MQELSKLTNRRRPHYRIVITRYERTATGAVRSTNKTRSLVPTTPEDETLPLEDMLEAAVGAVLKLTSENAA